MNRPPNILYLHSHDTGRYIGPYGYPVQTPNLQKLADEGVLFQQAFCANPTCSPSRAALLTGQAAHSSGMFGLAHRGWALNDYGQHIIHTLHEAGYTSALSGVQHVADHQGEEPWKKIGYKQSLEDFDQGAVEFLQSAPDEPFFLTVGFFETHRKFPELSRDDPEARHSFVPAPLPDVPDIRHDAAEYSKMARRLDERMGRVLDALESSGLAENTLVICTTDHGIAFPWMKGNLRDDGIGVMLLMRGPGGFTGGKRVNALVSHVDIFPTICDLVGIEHPDWLQGQSVLPLVHDDPVEKVRDEVFAETNYHAAFEPQRAVRTERYKYVVRLDGRDQAVLPNIDAGYSKTFLVEHGMQNAPRPAEGLYDLYLDPHEKRNLVSDPAHAETLKDLRERLIRWMRETDDPVFEGEIPWNESLILDDPDALNPGDRVKEKVASRLVIPEDFLQALRAAGGAGKYAGAA